MYTKTQNLNGINIVKETLKSWKLCKFVEINFFKKANFKHRNST